LTQATVRRFLPSAGLRPSEWLLLGYFSYTATLTLVLGLGPTRCTAALTVPLGLVLLVVCTRSLGRAASIARDWVALALVPIAYWQVDWFDLPGDRAALVAGWLVWDRILLDGCGVRAAVERFGWVLPWLLELSYALLYAVPPLAVGALYLCRRRDRVERFLFTFLLGTLLSYLLLPYFPSESPHILWPGSDLPGVSTFWRRFNLWVLGRYDVHTSVFPSGHVTAAFSAAFAMMLAIPERRWMGRLLLGLALSVTVVTVYGRYHYAADALAALVVSLVTAGVSAALRIGVTEPASRKFLTLERGPERG
jgi:membrane-associated phospholipid phosphatase